MNNIIQYNLKYINKNGGIIWGRRVNCLRDIELEDGRIVSKYWASKNLDYVTRFYTQKERASRSKGACNEKSL